ncbi:MAG: SDR family oxidoreductase [Verrucomicrobiota bacterium]
MKIFSEKVALVTGAASGIGRALCQELSASGASVVVADIDFAGAEAVAAELCKSRGRAMPMALDVASSAEVEKCVHETVSRHNRLDYMFNNAAVCLLGELRDSAPEHWRRILEVNLLGTIYGTMATYQVMIRQKSGHIVNVSSVTGLIPSPVLTHYSTTKWALVGFTTALREEAAGLGVKVTLACPSLVRTNIPDRTTYLRVDKQQYLDRLPYWLMMEPSQAARAILRGVARNRAMIVCPFHGRLLWWCWRLFPPLLQPLSRWSVREFRKLRREK